jgi:hypothetical protein
VALGAWGSEFYWWLDSDWGVWVGCGQVRVIHVEGVGWPWAPKQGTKPIFSHHPQTCGMSLIHEKWHKLQFALFGVAVDSFLDGSSFQLLDVHDCDHSDMYLGRDWTAFAHQYINC